MFRLCSARTACLAVSLTALSLGLQSGGALVSGAHAAGSKPVAGRSSSASSPPVIGRLQNITKNTLMLAQPGSKTITHIQLNAQTKYVVKGKRVAKQPVFTRGLLISVVTTQSKGLYTAQVVIVGQSAPPSGAATGPPPSTTNASPARTTTIVGIVTLATVASVTLKTSSGIETIKLTTATRYVVDGKASSLRPVIHAGEKVRVVAVLSNGVLLGQSFIVS